MRKYRADIRKNYTFIQAKTFLTKKQAEQWASEMDVNIEAILTLTPSKLKNLTPEIVNEMGGLDLCQKLGIELEFFTFKDLANEYMTPWTKKDPLSQVRDDVQCGVNAWVTFHDLHLGV